MAEDFGSPSSASAEAAELNELVAALALRTSDLESSANSFARAMTSAFSRAIVSGQDFDDVLQSLALRLSDLAVRMAFRPLERGMAGGLDQLFGGFFSASGSGPAGPSAAPAGVLTSSAGGRISNTEASVWGVSERTSGVESSARRAGVTVHISTPDAESFRRSETHVAGLIARAVARGQRSL